MNYSKIPLYFIENRGQLDPCVSYYIQGSDKTLYFTPQGVTLVLSEQGTSLRPVALNDRADESGAGERWTLKLDFIGANPGVKPEGRNLAPGTISYFKGRKDQHHTGLKTYGSIVYTDLWPGIDLEYTGTANQLKYNFIVKPGADPDRIKLAYRGATAVNVNDAGQLEVSTPVGGFHDDKPYSYQEVEGRRVEVATDYSLKAEPASNKHAYGFRVGDYDKSKPLVLDPVVVIYAGFIGGFDADAGRAIAVDKAGNAYITGLARSAQDTFPETVGPDLTYNGNVGDAFVAKINADGRSLAYCGYIGGTRTGGPAEDWGFDIAVDRDGYAYITGETSSNEGFPVTVGPDLTFNGGDSFLPKDAFVAKVAIDGTSLVYCGYIGGSANDIGVGIAVDLDGNAFVTGETFSSQTSFPVKDGPFLTYNGGSDAFVARVKADGTGLDYCGYIGGTCAENGSDIKVDASGHAYIVGDTCSRPPRFPVKVGPSLVNSLGGGDSFVAKVEADGKGLVYCGYIGGDGFENSLGIAIDSSGYAYITGQTDSTEATFPVKTGPDLTHNGGSDSFGEDAYVAKVEADGTGLVYCGYIGGSGDDVGVDIALDGEGNAYIIGETESNQTTFPVAGGPDLTFNGGRNPRPTDAFVAKVNVCGLGLEHCGYIGGSGDDSGSGIALDSAGSVYITGETQSTETTFPGGNGLGAIDGPDNSFNGFVDCFVVKIGRPAIPCYALQEIITVPVDGSAVVSLSTLDPGFRYKLRASGSFVIGGPGFADAEHGSNCSLSTIINHCFGSPSEIDFGIGINDAVIDNNKIPFWGSFNSEHVYTTDFIGQGAPISLNYHDCFYPDNSGSLTVEIFRLDRLDICLKDDSNPANTISIDSETGSFRFNCAGSLFVGRGVIARRGSIVSLSANQAGFRVSARIDMSVGRGDAALQAPPGTTRCTITDRDTRDDNCACED